MEIISADKLRLEKIIWLKDSRPPLSRVIFMRPKSQFVLNHLAISKHRRQDQLLVSPEFRDETSIETGSRPIFFKESLRETSRDQLRLVKTWQDQSRPNLAML